MGSFRCGSKAQSPIFFATASDEFLTLLDHRFISLTGIQKIGVGLASVFQFFDDNWGGDPWSCGI